ncbi:hypothetical protein BDR04DRAFT_792535 [Suillus decipiens]|nr:hypothetical protein BDR04DRAFT_792535 [Suillus decipiens]
MVKVLSSTLRASVHIILVVRSSAPCATGINGRTVHYMLAVPRVHGRRDIRALFPREQGYTDIFFAIQATEHPKMLSEVKKHVVLPSVSGLGSVQPDHTTMLYPELSLSEVQYLSSSTSMSCVRELRWI